jgi:hypothetical protein
MNDHDAMTVRVESTNEVRQVVEFDDADVRETLERLPSGTTVPLKMASVGTRGNAWRAVELVDSAAADRTAASRENRTADQTHAPDRRRNEPRETVEI